jgi:hypothetical protein
VLLLSGSHSRRIEREPISPSDVRSDARRRDGVTRSVPGSPSSVPRSRALRVHPSQSRSHLRRGRGEFAGGSRCAQARGCRRVARRAPAFEKTTFSRG